ncbi:nitrate/nitrite transporter [uncultured Litoreibacter sp.]|uniref:MFS transporter n=1 Tax=uncultured Litoreibacter sp. TaxID=1392394 RepID=UPI00262CF730|nr:MFS transporter [uncultured Litoreibacter sp.]
MSYSGWMGTLQFIRDNLKFLSAGFLLTFASCFGQTFFISIFAGEIMAEFDLTHGRWGAIYMVGTLASAAVMVWAGALTDRFRVRRLGGIVLGGMVAACAFMSINNSVWLLPLAVFALRLMGQGMLSHLAAVSMARWYVAARGRALAIASFGYLVGEALLPLIFVSALGFIGWRWSWGISAMAALALLPIMLMLLKAERTPQAVAEENQAVGLGGKHWTRNEVLRHWLFWLLVPLLIGPSTFGTAFFFHQVHLAEVKGWTHLQMVSLFPVYTVTSTIISVIAGFAIDRFGAGRVLPVLLIPVAVGFFIFSATATMLGAVIGVVLFGVSSGMNATAPSAFWAEYFGTRNLGSIKAMATAVMVLGSAIGPGLTGWVIDAGMNYSDQMAWVSLYFLIAAGMTFVGIWKAERGLVRI